MSNLEFLSHFRASMGRRAFLKNTGALGLTATSFSAFLASCGSNTTASSTPVVNMSGPIDMNTLISNAKKEGKLEAVGIPPEWADYKDTLANYAAKYVPVQYKAEAEYSSAQELEVFTKSKIHTHGDIGDVGFKFGAEAVKQNLVTPYKHANWADIDANLKDPAGNWCTGILGSSGYCCQYRSCQAGTNFL